MIWRGPWQRTENLFRAWTPFHAFLPCTRETLKTKQKKFHRLPTPSQPLRRYLLSTWTPLSPDMTCEKGVRSPHHHRAASLYAGVCFWTTNISNARRPHFLFLRREGREAADPAKPKNATNHGFYFYHLARLVYRVRRRSHCLSLPLRAPPSQGSINSFPRLFRVPCKSSMNRV